MYKLFDINNVEIHQHNLQDKIKWCKDGEKIENVFIEKYGNQLGLIINPEKKNNPYVPDLLNVNNGKLADLKLQSTPFFKSKSLCNLDPTYTVVFNVKDRLRYQKLYPNIEVYYWIKWDIVKFQTEYVTIEVTPINGVWKTDFLKFNQYLRKCPVHSYLQRGGDISGNAKESYICNINNEVFNKLK